MARGAGNVHNPGVAALGPHCRRPPRGTSAATAELAQSLWLSQGPRKEAPLPRAIARMVAFRAGARHGAVLAVRTTLPGYTCPVPSAALPFRPARPPALAPPGRASPGRAMARLPKGRAMSDLDCVGRCACRGMRCEVCFPGDGRRAARNGAGYALKDGRPAYAAELGTKHGMPSGLSHCRRSRSHQRKGVA